MFDWVAVLSLIVEGLQTQTLGELRLARLDAREGAQGKRNKAYLQHVIRANRV
jgi:hypothetical protein